MKKLVYLLTILGAIVTGCNPLEDINNEIDAQANPVSGAFDYTLVEDDYTGDILDLDVSYFQTVDALGLAIPAFLADKYPTLGEGSSVNLGYNLFVGDADGVSGFITSDTYSLQNSDYASFGSDAFGFYPNETPEDFIPAILAAQVVDPIDNQLVLSTFKQYVDTPVVGLASVYQATFPADYDSFELISVSGPDELGWTVGAANVQGSGFSGGAVATEEWLISPEIDLAGQTDLKFQITQEIDFLGDSSLIDILISTNYTTGGDVMAAEWTVFTFDKTIYGDLATSEDFDFSAYDGETIHVGLMYTSTDDDSPRWRVQDFAVRSVGIEGDTESLGEYYTYSGSEWELTDDVYYLSSKDYNSMGEESGQPGRFDNFSNSVPPEDYLSTFLDIKYPFAQEDDALYLVYKYFDSGSTDRQGNLYTYTNGEWLGDTDIIATSLQFGFTDGLWEPDNTIRYTLDGDDYTYISSQLISEAGFEAAADNLGSFASFEIRETDNEYWSPEMILTAMGILLDNIDPNADEAQKYILSYKTYSGTVLTAEISLIKEGGEWIVNVN